MASKLIASLLMMVLYGSVMAYAQGGWDGPLWSQKVTLLFECFDLDQNQLHDSNDVALLAAAYATWGPISQALITTSETAMWVKLYANAPPGSTLNVATLIQCLKSLGEGDMILDVLAYAPMYFVIIDTNNNGVIDATEYNFFFKILGLPPNVITAAFNTFSNGGTGITPSQYVAGWQEYFTTSNPTDKFNSILGPLNYGN